MLFSKIKAKPKGWLLIEISSRREKTFTSSPNLRPRSELWAVRGIRKQHCVVFVLLAVIIEPIAFFEKKEVD
jgi:hypothetical protein